MRMNTCTHYSCLYGFSIGLTWFLISSALLFFTWNYVVTEFTKMKKAKYWQALLVVATICIFCMPRAYMRNRCYHQNSCCHHMSKGGMSSGSECPYSGKDDSDDDKK